MQLIDCELNKGGNYKRDTFKNGFSFFRRWRFSNMGKNQYSENSLGGNIWIQM